MEQTVNMKMTKNPIVQNLIELLNQNQQMEAANDVFEMAAYIDVMEQKMDTVIQELADVVNGDVQDVLDRLDAVVDADKSYTAFDGWDKDQDGSVKFLIETAGIE